MTRSLRHRTRIPIARGSVALAALLFAVNSAGCRARLHAGPETLAAEIPAGWSTAGGSDPVTGDAPWWTSFGAQGLEAALDDVLGGSFELREAWTRLAAAEANSRVNGAPRYPTLDLNTSVQQFRIETSGSSSAGGIPIRLGETYSLGVSLGYELDLFGRIGAALASARLEEAATAADVQATALTLSGRAADAWFTIVENRALADVVRDQIATGEQLLDVTRNRFATGSGSVLDVLQQQRQLEATRAEAPRFDGAAERALHSLNVLAGRPPRAETADATRRLPPLPPLPDVDVPAALLGSRPDLVAALRRVERTDRDVAVAIANRYPRLSLSGSYNFDGNEVALIFDRTIQSITASLVTPLIDGGRRRAEVDRQRANLDGAIAALSQAFLAALQEVEDALSLELRGLERLAALDAQAEIARQEVEQATRRYVGGVDSYLQVLTAIGNEQVLERQRVTEEAGVLRARAQLLRALGGAWTRELRPPAEGRDPALTHPDAPNQRDARGPRS